MSRTTARLVLGALLVGWVAAPASAQPEVITGVFTVDLRPAIHEVGPDQDREEAALIGLFELARFSFGGMVFGFTFDYDPGELARRNPEEFVLQPLGTIPWGDPAVRTRDTQQTNSILSTIIDFTVDEARSPWFEGWRRSGFPTAGGRGSASTTEGTVGMVLAVEDAMRAALRSHLRATVPDRPERVRGRLALDAVPRVSIHRGEYVAVVRIRIDVADIRSRRAF